MTTINDKMGWCVTRSEGAWLSRWSHVWRTWVFRGGELHGLLWEQGPSAGVLKDFTDDALAISGRHLFQIKSARTMNATVGKAFLFFFCAWPLNLANVCILRSGIKKRKSAHCSPSSDLTGLYKSPKWKDGLHLWSKGQMNFGTALTDFNSRQFKTWMKKMAAQVEFCLFLNVFFLSGLHMVPENWHICVNKGPTYLLYKHGGMGEVKNSKEISEGYGWSWECISDFHGSAGC